MDAPHVEHEDLKQTEPCAAEDGTFVSTSSWAGTQRTVFIHVFVAYPQVQDISSARVPSFAKSQSRPGPVVNGARNIQIAVCLAVDCSARLSALEGKTAVDLSIQLIDRIAKVIAQKIVPVAVRRDHKDIALLTPLMPVNCQLSKPTRAHVALEMKLATHVLAPKLQTLSTSLQISRSQKQRHLHPSTSRASKKYSAAAMQRTPQPPWKEQGGTAL